VEGEIDICMNVKHTKYIGECTTLVSHIGPQAWSGLPCRPNLIRLGIIPSGCIGRLLTSLGVDPGCINSLIQ
jgi:hypothetical protein